MPLTVIALQMHRALVQAAMTTVQRSLNKTRRRPKPNTDRAPDPNAGTGGEADPSREGTGSTLSPYLARQTTRRAVP